MKHTRGPWNVYFENHKLRVDADGKKNKRYICNMVQYGNAGKPLYYYEAEAADARLIAASPDLLDALYYTLGKLSEMVDCDECRLNDHHMAHIGDIEWVVEQAIAKATKEDT